MHVVGKTCTGEAPANTNSMRMKSANIVVCKHTTANQQILLFFFQYLDALEYNQTGYGGAKWLAGRTADILRRMKEAEDMKAAGVDMAKVYEEYARRGKY